MEFGVWDVTLSVPTVLEGNPGDQVAAEFHYRGEEPYAVAAVFTARDVAVEWAFARDLLAEGLLRATGEGDVLVTPVDDQVRLVLRSPEGQAALLCDRSALEQFLRESQQVVAPGEESTRLDLDELINALTASG